jgi:CRP-like cAMP-binding protein
MEIEHQEIFGELLSQPYPLPPKIIKLLTVECSIVHFKKQQKISEGEEINTSEYFLLEGIMHRYTLIDKGEFITTGFYVGPTIITPNFARTSKGKSIFSLQALTDLTVAEISVAMLDELRDSNQEIRKWGQQVVELELKNHFADETRFRSSKARERLIYLRNNYPNLENLVPHTCIASYLGITPVSFSRLRKELARCS